MATGLKLSNVLCASDIMTKKLVKLSPEQDVFHAIDLLVKNKISGAPVVDEDGMLIGCLLYTSPSPRDQRGSRMPSSA